MKELLLVILAIFMVSAHVPTSVRQGRVIHVHKNGKDVKECLSVEDQEIIQPNQFCQSLEFVANELASHYRNVTIVLETSICLNKRALFKDFDFLAIQGQNVTVSCKYNNSNEANTGLSFLNIHQLQLWHIKVSHCCGARGMYTAVFLIEKCTNVTIQGLNFYSNRFGNALALVNTLGAVNVRNCNFSYNGRVNVTDSGSSFAGGLHIHFSIHTYTVLTIENSIFDHNVSPPVYALDPSNFSRWNGNGIGGGLGILLLENSSDIIIHVLKCTFVKNQASWGGGMCIYMQTNTFNNTVTIRASTFSNNIARVGGGGVQIRLGTLKTNLIIFKYILFMRNRAEFGGGTSVSALYVSNVTEPGEIIQFLNCKWFENTGTYSYAVDLSPYRFQQSSQGYLPIPVFRNTCFQRNHPYTVKKNTTHVTIGVFIVTRFSVQFQHKTTFKENWYSAIYITSGQTIFDAESTVVFRRNHAIKGGAIAIQGFSALVIHDNSNFLFENNTAARVGGGIFYASSDQREYFEGRNCFMEYGGRENNVTKRNISFMFVNNKAPLGGSSIYSASLFSCYFAYYANYTNESDLSRVFDSIGHFQFDVNSDSIATGARKVKFTAQSPVETYPGKATLFPLAMYDEFDHIMRSEFALRIEGNKFIHLENYYTVNNKTNFYGLVNESATLVLSTPQPLYNVDCYIKVKLLPCPPGFYYNQQSNTL